MKKSLLIVFAALCAASNAFGGGGWITVIQDGATSATQESSPALSSFSGTAFRSPFYNCIENAGPMNPPTPRVYVVHDYSDGTTGSAFSAVIPSCAGLVALVDIPQVPVYTGAQPPPAVPSQVGAWAEYDSCRTGFITVVQIFVASVAPAAGCCNWLVQENPAAGSDWPISMDCSTPSQEEQAYSGLAIVQADIGCCTVPTSESTWGAVKELFRHGN